MNRLPEKSQLSILRDQIALLKLSRDRKNNLMQRLWSLEDDAGDISSKLKMTDFGSFVVGELVSHKNRMRDTAAGEAGSNFMYRLFRREIDMDTSFESAVPEHLPFLPSPSLEEAQSNTSYHFQEEEGPVALFKYPKGHTIEREQPTSSFLLPLAVNYLPRIQRKVFFSQGIAFHLLVDKENQNIERYFILKNDFLFEFRGRTHAEEGSYPIGILSLFCIDSFVLHNGSSLELEFSPSYIDYDDYNGFEDEEDLSVCSGPDNFKSKDFTEIPLIHQPMSCSHEIFGPSRSFRPRKIMLKSPPRDGSAVSRLVSYIEDFHQYDKGFLQNCYNFRKVPIGRGKFSAVFEATSYDKSTTKCAIKVIKKADFWQCVQEKTEKPGTLSREIGINLYLREQQGANGYFVFLQEILESEKLLVFEMKLMQSMDLFQYVSQSPTLSENYIRKLAVKLLSALQFLQSHGIAHRDVKLSNVVLKGEQLEPRLIDFGLAMFEDENGKFYGRCGTPGFIAPEILNSKNTDGYMHNVDVFSLGVVLFIVLAGYEPFIGSTERELLQANKKCQVFFDSKRWCGENICPSTRDMIESMLEPLPALRPSAATILCHPWLDSDREVSNKEKECQELKKRFNLCAIS